ncbi:MAG: sugar ABC transporter ATP-binding protein [Rhodobacterales bacterium]|nr:sugar ABC transporter ATP-binding protein [Rhodobacterales bacterium]
MPGEVLALVGENGAGKSTLMRLIEGVFPPDSGEIHVEGKRVAFNGPRSAHEAGIRVIHQEPEIVPHMTVGENIFIGNLPKRAGVLLDSRELSLQTARLLSEFGMDQELSPDQRCEGLGPAQRQMIEIMRAVHAGGRLVAFDEPTSSLTDEEARRLFAIIRRLRSEGVAVVYISHRLPEIIELADRIAVLRDGSLVDVTSAAGASEESITRKMVGRDLSEMFPSKDPHGAEIILRVEGLTTDHVTDISFDLRAGEVLGIGGLMGAGRSELAKGIFGFHRRRAGRVMIDGVDLPGGDTAAAIMAGLGFAPEDRKEEALLLLQSILDNAVICIPDKITRGGLFSKTMALGVIGDIARQLAIKAPTLDTPVGRLSGGNQQKVVLARWLARQPKVLILDEPTRGIDVGAKSEIYALIRNLTRAGLGVIVISSEMPELIGLSDRVMVMAGGRITAELAGSEMTEDRILRAAMPQAARPILPEGEVAQK